MALRTWALMPNPSTECLAQERISQPLTSQHSSTVEVAACIRKKIASRQVKFVMPIATIIVAAKC